MLGSGAEGRVSIRGLGGRAIMYFLCFLALLTRHGEKCTYYDQIKPCVAGCNGARYFRLARGREIDGTGSL